MKRFVIFLLALSLACEAPREASDMSFVYDPDPTSTPATITLPLAGDPVASAVVDQAFKYTASDQDITIVAASDVGILYGAYEILVRLGFRWYAPDRAWEHRPAALRPLQPAPGPRRGRSDIAECTPTMMPSWATTICFGWLATGST